MRVRVTLRVDAAAARAVPPPEGLVLRHEGGRTAAEVEAGTLEEALAAVEAWLAAVRAGPSADASGGPGPVAER